MGYPLWKLQTTSNFKLPFLQFNQRIHQRKFMFTAFWKCIHVMCVYTFKPVINWKATVLIRYNVDCRGGGGVNGRTCVINGLSYVYPLAKSIWLNIVTTFLYYMWFGHKDLNLFKLNLFQTYIKHFPAVALITRFHVLGRKHVTDNPTIEQEGPEGPGSLTWGKGQRSQCSQ